MLAPEIQQKLIAETINSAICIDNEYVEAYADTDNAANRETSRKLYEAFRENGSCHLDIYTFKDFATYQRDKEKILHNRDLVILDWELDNGQQCNYEDALAILDDVCQNDQIHFVDIYTQDPNHEEIAQTIYSYFKLQQRDILKPHVDEIIEIISDLIDGFGLEFDSDNAKSIIDDKLGSFIMNPDRREEIVKQIKKDIFQAIADGGGDNDTKKALCNELRELFDKDAILKTHYDFYRAYCICNLCSSPKVSNSGLKAKAISPTTVLVKGTVIHVTSKNDVTPDKLFENIGQAVIGIPKHRSLLLSLLLKQMVRKNLATVGKELGSISEVSLIAHCANLRKEGVAEENVGNFVVSALTEHICSVFQNSETASLLNSIIDGNIESNSGFSLEEEHIKLNSMLTFLPKDKMMAGKHQIKTGDVFILDRAIASTDKKDSHSYQYLLCITQSCDALRPSKVNNNLAFALGEVAKNSSDVKKAETEFHTFLPEKQIVVWTNKFFTIFVKDTIFSLTPDAGKFTFHYIDGDFTATFLGTQKEAYTHRIINNVFSNAMRIGIDLPHKLG